MGLNGAACHACCLIAETSCDHNNILLNRLLVSGNQLINGRGKVEPKGFFQEFLISLKVKYETTPYNELEPFKTIFEDNKDKNILVVGPPTGKTIVAFHKALLLEKMGKKVVFIMYNKVLLKYTKSTNINTNIYLSTMNSWISKMWSKSKFLKVGVLTIDDEKYMIDWLKVYNEIKLIKNKSDLEQINWGHIIIDEGQDFPEEMFLSKLSYQHLRMCLEFLNNLRRNQYS